MVYHWYRACRQFHPLHRVGAIETIIIIFYGRKRRKLPLGTPRPIGPLRQICTADEQRPAHEGGGHPALPLWAAGNVQLKRRHRDISRPGRRRVLIPLEARVGWFAFFLPIADTLVLLQMTMLSHPYRRELGVKLAWRWCLGPD